MFLTASVVLSDCIHSAPKEKQPLADDEDGQDDAAAEEEQEEQEHEQEQEQEQEEEQAQEEEQDVDNVSGKTGAASVSLKGAPTDIVTALKASLIDKSRADLNKMVTEVNADLPTQERLKNTKSAGVHKDVLIEFLVKHQLAATVKLEAATSAASAPKVMKCTPHFRCRLNMCTLWRAFVVNGDEMLRLYLDTGQLSSRTELDCGEVGDNSLFFKRCHELIRMPQEAFQFSKSSSSSSSSASNFEDYYPPDGSFQNGASYLNILLFVVSK